jgi:hypothetical protein
MGVAEQNRKRRARSYMAEQEKDRETSYTGPLVVLTKDESEELEFLLINNPLPWNKDLRRRIVVAKERLEK